MNLKLRDNAIINSVAGGGGHVNICFNSYLLLEDGTHFFGVGVGKTGTITGEICFNTAMTGYQEVLTDPSYAGQIITFSFPHIGNVGVNDQDMESGKPHLKGIVLKDFITSPSSHRSQGNLNDWLIKYNVTGIAHVDTRCLIKLIRNKGPIKALIYHGKEDLMQNDFFHLPRHLKQKLQNEKGLENRNLSLKASTKKKYHFNTINPDEKKQMLKVVVLDFGVKRNILSLLKSHGCDVIVLPSQSSFEEIMEENPDGILLSNGPGDPRPRSVQTTPIVKKTLKEKIPLFGICLGHQLLGLALGGKIEKMITGHHGVNHPVQNLKTSAVEITSQNHEFTLNEKSLPVICTKTHRSLFDGTLQGIEVRDAPAFSVQFHPEASPGPHDSAWLFEKFINMVRSYAKKN